jgi:hypothetical protein
MSPKARWIMAVFIPGFFVSSGLAVYFRMEAETARIESSARQLQLERLQASAPATLPTRPEPAAPPPGPAPAPVFTASDVEEATTLRERVQQLESALTRQDALVASLQSAAAAPPAATNRPWRGREDWLNTLRAEEPERYQEILRRREEARRRVQNEFARKAAYLLGQDVSSRSRAEKEEHAKLLELLDETWRLSAQLQASTRPREERRAIFRALRENMEELAPRLEAEREREFHAAGRQLGYNEQDAAAFAAYLNEIIELTSMRSVMQNMRPRFESGEGPGAEGTRGPPGAGAP